MDSDLLTAAVLIIMIAMAAGTVIIVMGRD